MTGGEKKSKKSALQTKSKWLFFLINNVHVHNTIFLVVHLHTSTTYLLPLSPHCPNQQLNLWWCGFCLLSALHPNAQTPLTFIFKIERISTWVVVVVVVVVAQPDCLPTLVRMSQAVTQPKSHSSLPKHLPLHTRKSHLRRFIQRQTLQFSL